MSIKPSNDVTYLCGNAGVFDSSYCDQPFSDQVMSFCSTLSRLLLTNHEVKQYPDLITFAFYCRKANLEQLKSTVADVDQRLGWGTALHVAPSNIPINFAYSFLFGLLAGNANAVRVPSKNFPQIEMFCNLVDELFANPDYQALASSNAFIRFSRDSDFLKNIIAHFDCLLIWGGDQTVTKIRQLPRAPRSIEIAFSDRYSFAVLGASDLLTLDNQALQKLCADFYNDTYLVDQNACSSPSMVCWQGKESDVKAAKQRFWPALQDYLKSRYETNAVQLMDKQIKLLKYLEQFPVDINIREYGAAITVATLNQLDSYNHELKGVFGLFFETEHASLEDVIAVVNKKYQTLSYFGVDAQQIKDTVFKQRVKGIDRIVPVGAALDISIVWDGYDLINHLSRIITVK